MQSVTLANRNTPHRIQLELPIGNTDQYPCTCTRQSHVDYGTTISKNKHGNNLSCVVTDRQMHTRPHAYTQTHNEHIHPFLFSRKFQESYERKNRISGTANYKRAHLAFFLLGFGGLRTARIASSNTCFRPFCVSAEHSKYFTELTSLAICSPCG